jgi:hypothetical protein
MFNFQAYFDLVNNYKKNNTEFKTLSQQLDTEKLFMSQIDTIDTKYFSLVDKELARNNMYIYKNMIVDTNVYDSLLNYFDYIDKMLTEHPIDYGKILKDLDGLVGQLAKIEELDLLMKLEKKIIDGYTTKINYSQDTKPIEPIKFMFWEKIKNYSVGKVNLNDWFDESTGLAKSYLLKSKVSDQLNNTRELINTYTKSVLTNDINYSIKINESNVQIVNDIISKLNYEDIPTFGKDKIITGGALNSVLKDQQKQIFNSLIVQEKIVFVLNQIKKSIESYFVSLYNIYMYSIFIANSQVSRSYSLFVFNKLSKSLISKFYDSVISIPNLNKKNYSIVLNIIRNFLLLEISGTPSTNISISKNINFVLLIDKLNILLRQHNEDKLINKTIKINNFDTDEIFIAGNRNLENDFYIFYNANNMNFSSEQDMVLFLGKLMFYFFVPNLYLINDIKINEHPDINIWTLKDIMFTKLNTQSSVYKKLLTEKYEIKINSTFTYYFYNYNDFASVNLSGKKYLIFNF